MIDHLISSNASTRYVSSKVGPIAAPDAQLSLRSTCVMLLCEVALGEMEEMKQANNHSNSVRTKAGKMSVKGLGSNAPDEKGAKEIKTGVKVPCGKVVAKPVDGGHLLYNEYIVYDTAQIKMRYAIKMKFNYN